MVRILPLDPEQPSQFDWVAQHMRATMLEVVGKDLYSVDWLLERVHQHLPGGSLVGAVFLAFSDKETIVGHLILRDESHHGLISTIYVLPDHRRQGVAQLLLDKAEDWFTQRRLHLSQTYTHPENYKLHRLFQGRGYSLHPVNHEFVRLEKPLQPKSLEQ